MDQNPNDESSIISKKVILQSIGLVIIIGVILALTSNLISRFLGHYINLLLPVIQGKLWLLLLIYYLYLVAQAVIVFLPVTPADVAVFVLVGVKYVFIFNFAGTMTAYIISYFIARRFGRRFLKKILPLKTYNRVTELSHKMSWRQLIFVSLLPITHLDLMPYVAGLSKIKFKTVVAALTLVVVIRLAFVLFILNQFWVR